jgi:hypothetical protein
MSEGAPTALALAATARTNSSTESAALANESPDVRSAQNPTESEFGMPMIDVYATKGTFNRT